MKPNLLKQAEVTEKPNEGQERKILPVCFLCHKVPEQGLRNGFFLRGIFICHDCEIEIINSKAQDKKEYLHAIARLRQILFKK